jgi:FixJ family two-component response regulator
VVYIVDDDDSVRKSLARLLKSMGMEAETFCSAEEFLYKRGKHEECLILDIGLPGMSGIELQQALARSGDNIPIIFITAKDDEELPMDVIAKSGSTLLHKPFDDHELLAAIQASMNSTAETKL